MNPPTPTREPEPADPADAMTLAALEEAIALALRDPLSLADRDDLDAFVPTIPLQSFHALALQLYAEGRLDLLFPHASPEQLTAVIDLGGWEGDRVDVVRVREWLLAIIDTFEGAGLARGALASLVTAMDPELWTFALLPGTAIHELDADDDEARDQAIRAVEHLYTYETPDGFFIVAVPDDPLGRTAIRILDALYHDDLALGRDVVVSVRTALHAVLEDDLMRWRNARLADLGFVPWEEAMKLLRPLSREAALARLGEADPIAAAVGPREHVAIPGTAGLLRRVLGRLSPAEHGVRTREFLLLVNELSAARRLPPGDPKAQAEAILQVHATLNLGLEILAGSAPEAQELDDFLGERLVALGLRDLFRVGYDPLDKIRRAALALHRGGQASLSEVGSLLDRPWGPALRSFVAWVPELPLEGAAAHRPISTLADVARAAQMTAEAVALTALAFGPRGYGIAPEWVHRVDEPARLVLGDLVRTAAVHRQLPGHRGDLAPLSPADLLWAREHLLAGGRLRPALVDDFEARAIAVGATPTTASALREILLGRLEIELGSLELGDDGQPDLVRVGGLVTIQRVGVWLQTGLTQES